MNPDNEDHLLLAAYLDGELSPGETIEMERKLATDPVLRQLRDRLHGLSGSLHQILSEVPVPVDLGARAAERFGNVEVLSSPQLERRRWPSVAAALLVGLLAGGVAGYGLPHIGEARNDDRTLAAIYAGHLRGLAASDPFDIASSDRHVVKPWFNGRTAIAPDAPDFGPEGYPLAGGRVDIVDGQKVPTLVYRRRQHVISVTVVPKIDIPETEAVKREGTNIERWDAGDLSYVAVSDLNGAELREFANLFRSRTTPRP